MNIRRYECMYENMRIFYNYPAAINFTPNLAKLDNNLEVFLEVFK